jgi:SNF2 family DNA or RNA helicase
MLEQEKSPIGGGILADACGTGKTTTLITALGYSSLRAANDPTHIHRPILGLCYSALIDTWLGELRARLGDSLRILLFQGSSLHTSDYLRLWRLYTHRVFRWLRGENQGDLDRRIAEQGQRIEQLVIIVQRILNQFEDISARLADDQYE